LDKCNRARAAPVSVFLHACGRHSELDINYIHMHRIKWTKTALGDIYTNRIAENREIPLYKASRVAKRS
jgi:hypothetical protein